jgi:hypothetical protein
MVESSVTMVFVMLKLDPGEHYQEIEKIREMKG